MNIAELKTYCLRHLPYELDKNYVFELFNNDIVNISGVDYSTISDINIKVKLNSTYKYLSSLVQTSSTIHILVIAKISDIIFIFIKRKYMSIDNNYTHIIKEERSYTDIDEIENGHLFISVDPSEEYIIKLIKLMAKANIDFDNIVKYLGVSKDYIISVINPK